MWAWPRQGQVAAETHVSVPGCGSHSPVHAGDVGLGSGDQRRAGVHDGLAAALARHHLAVDGDTARGRAWTSLQAR